MDSSNNLIHSWVNYSKFYSRLYNALDTTLQQQYQLNLSGFYLLYYLSNSPNKTNYLTELQPKVGLSHSALSRLITRLESYNNTPLLIKTVNDVDKRSSFISLTQKGEGLLNQIVEELNNTLKNSLSEGDIEHILQIVNS